MTQTGGMRQGREVHKGGNICTPISTLANSCEELTHWKRLWCWEGLGARGEGDDRGWDGWMASPTRWTWVWVNSTSWWWTGRPGVLQFMGSQRVGHDWATELNWTELKANISSTCLGGKSLPSGWLVILQFIAPSVYTCSPSFPPIPTGPFLST